VGEDVSQLTSSPQFYADRIGQVYFYKEKEKVAFDDRFCGTHKRKYSNTGTLYWSGFYEASLVL
jgi:hypothetical protein